MGPVAVSGAMGTTIAPPTSDFGHLAGDLRATIIARRGHVPLTGWEEGAMNRTALAALAALVLAGGIAAAAEFRARPAEATLRDAQRT